jgi:hypothetical protein
VLYNNDGVSRGTEPVAHSGLAQIYAGHHAAKFFGVPYSDPRYPDVFGRVQLGAGYTGGSKVAEHGGDNPGPDALEAVQEVGTKVLPGMG